MFDARIRPHIDPTLNRVAQIIAQTGISANAITVIGFAIGMVCCVCILLQSYSLALGCLIANRLMDGLDGALARQSTPTDVGAYLDLTLDFIFYAAFVFAFAITAPEFAFAAAFLLFSFMGTASTFLAFATLAEKRGLKSEAQGKKTIYYLSGITEGSETIMAFIAMCLLPQAFDVIAYVFGSLCMIATAARIKLAVGILREVR